MMRMCATLGMFGALSVLTIAGCGGAKGPDLGKVQGTVTQNGSPVSGAIVMFIPATGAPSSGKTDEAGRYELRANDGRPGAVLGKHKVSITIPGTEAPPPMGGQATPPPPGKPAQEFSKEAEVKPGDNDLPFKL